MVRGVVGRAQQVTQPSFPQVERLAFLDELAKSLGRVEHRKARERKSHPFGYGPTLVWIDTDYKGTLVVLPYSSGSGVVRLHFNRYSREIRLPWTAEITVMPDELIGLVPWIERFVRAISLGVALDFPELFEPHPSLVDGVRTKYVGVWSKKARAEEEAHALNVRGRRPVKEKRNA